MLAKNTLTLLHKLAFQRFWLGISEWLTMYFLFLASCGGSIISHHVIMSAAHCFDQPNRIKSINAIIGHYDISEESKTKIVAVNSILKHPDHISGLFSRH